MPPLAPIATGLLSGGPDPGNTPGTEFGDRRPLSYCQKSNLRVASISGHHDHFPWGVRDKSEGLLRGAMEGWGFQFQSPTSLLGPDTFWDLLWDLCSLLKIFH